ncbi:MAG TPA: 2-dehydropantoate 2-reductase, partial [Candidatus Dormibacteraeota bacterium]|nr:2-dehydropantoate 2-reductase [Candidatus Dormibacteraeota bacterium]
MRHAVLGAGGIGGLVGGALARSGNPVTLLLRQESAGHHPPSLTVKSRVLGDFEVPVTVATELSDEVDVVWLAVKASQLDSALAAVPAGRLRGALVIPLMNGVDHVAALRRVYPPASVAAGVILTESERGAPGEIIQVSPFATIKLAAHGPSAARTREVAEEVRSAGLACDVVDDEVSMLWGKLAFLAPLALTTTAMSAPLGAVRTDPAWGNRLERCLGEVCAAAESAGAIVDRAATLSRMTEAPENMRSSMQKDVAAGR